jgi:hypothetical protein
MSLPWTGFCRLLVAALGAALVIGACGGDDGEDGDLTWSQLRNTAYPSAVTPGEEVVLQDGQSHEGGEDGPLTARLVDVGAFGDLGGDRGDDAAVFLSEVVGDGKQVVSLVVVVDDDGEPRVEASEEIGTDVVTRGVFIGDGQISVLTLPAANANTDLGSAEEVTQVYELQRGDLELVDEATATVGLDPATFLYERTQLGPTAGERESVARTLPPRGIAPFLISGAEGQRLAVSLESANDSAILSIQGLGDESQILSFREYATVFDAELPATQEYAVRVVSVSGSDLDVNIEYEMEAPPVPTATPPPAPVPQTVSELASTVPILFEGNLPQEDAALGDVSQPAADFFPEREPLRGIAVIVPDEGLAYVENGDEQMETASVIKVVVMACVMHRAELQGRLVDELELSLMWPMITESNNDATDALWSDLGGGPGVAACLESLGAGGITPYMGPYWGTSTASARGIADLMARLAYGDLVVAEHRAAALVMLISVISGQRWGVSAGADASGEEIVGVKDGWYPDEAGWRVNSVGFISPLGFGEVPYAIAVMTNLQATQEYGIETIEGLAEPVWTDIRAR